MKGNVLFWMVFLTFSALNTYVAFFLMDRFLPGTHSFFMVILIILFLTIIIPITAIISEKLVKFALGKGLRKQQNFNWFIAIVTVVPVCLYGLFLFNTFKEKGLDKVIDFHADDYHSMQFSVQGDPTHGWKTDEQQPVEELVTFLSDYKVKKMNDAAWDSDVAGLNGFKFTIVTDGKPIMAGIYENCVHFYTGGAYYKVLNGPIDTAWVQEYDEKYQ
ncbi:hypothetical protein [Oceanobacillus kapialis]|uniref:DUF2812 domain-containing protein n=1 Tax=Oceanobacillus kapialis TaxID=481353 RepID=A0ABW5Q2T9_9BACI